MHAFSYTWSVVTSGHVTMMAVTQFDPPQSETTKCMQSSWLHVCYCTEVELLLIKVYIAGIRIFYIFSSRELDPDPTTFTYELDPIFPGDVQDEQK